MKWRAAGAAFHARMWDGDLVVYDEYSGETHWLNPVASVILSAIHQRGPCAVEELRSAILPLLTDEGRSSTETVIDSALDTLRRLRLVESVAA